MGAGEGFSHLGNKKEVNWFISEVNGVAETENICSAVFNFAFCVHFTKDIIISFNLMFLRIWAS